MQHHRHIGFGRYEMDRFEKKKKKNRYFPSLIFGQ